MVDLSGAETGDPLRHSKFAQNPDVVRFLGEELINGASRDPQAGLRERMDEMSMGVAQGVSGAAGLALGAPIAIVDPEVRHGYANRLQQFRQAVDSAVASGPDW